MRERTRLEQGLGAIDDLSRDLADNVELLEMGEAEGDKGIIAEAEAALEAAQKVAAKAELLTLLSGEADANNCYLEVHAGAGGTEADRKSVV